MSIESIIIVFSLGLIASLIIFLFAGLIYSKIKRVEPEDTHTIPVQHKIYLQNTSTQNGLSKYASIGRFSKYPVINPSNRQTRSNGNSNSNGLTHPAHSSFYTVVNSSRQISYLNKQNFN